ncbi:hypothetical protein PRK78_000715 [Emydomyces testavorans]|uniref:Uncharacterized protein n=1 Tax=Emydomyces testavorans TaxID=2070801 RepID=A0AAF0IG52_9EURO|nr:hypothetical protein PRK78_000715 [Emydomyces testavorans]
MRSENRKRAPPALVLAPDDRQREISALETPSRIPFNTPRTSPSTTSFTTSTRSPTRVVLVTVPPSTVTTSPTKSLSPTHVPSTLTVTATVPAPVTQSSTQWTSAINTTTAMGQPNSTSAAPMAGARTSRLSTGVVAFLIATGVAGAFNPPMISSLLTGLGGLLAGVLLYWRRKKRNSILANVARNDNQETSQTRPSTSTNLIPPMVTVSRPASALTTPPGSDRDPFRDPSGPVARTYEILNGQRRN